MLMKLFGSRIRINILKLFIFGSQKEYYAREMERLIKVPFEPMRRELIRLELAGLLKSRVSGRQKYYSIKIEHPLYGDIKSMILKTVGLGDLLRTAIDKENDIVLAFIYGSYAKDTENTESDIDLFIVGDISSKELQAVISDIEFQAKREINPTIYAIKELKKKYKAKHHFILSILKGSKIFIKGNDNALKKLVSSK